MEKNGKYKNISTWAMKARDIGSNLTSAQLVSFLAHIGGWIWVFIPERTVRNWFYLHLPISPVDETPWVPLTVLDQSCGHIPPSTWQCFNTLAQKKPLRMARYAEWTLKRVACKNGTIGYNWCNLVWSTIILLAVLPLYPLSYYKLIYFKRRSKMEVSRGKPLVHKLRVTSRNIYGDINSSESPWQVNMTFRVI